VLLWRAGTTSPVARAEGTLKSALAINVRRGDHSGHWPDRSRPIIVDGNKKRHIFFFDIIYLALRSGHNYTVPDTEAHATDYAGVTGEGHGGMTGFLWITFLAIGAWTVLYLVEHWFEFSVLFEK